ncbi:MAG: glycosyltransferase family 4 protein [Desulfovibrionaceae bacterium]
MRTVLFVESGGSGGGSFQSLYLILKTLDRERFRPMVAFLSRTRYVEEVRALGVPVRVLTDWAFSTHVPWWLRKRFEHTVYRSHRRFPGALADWAVRLAHFSLLHGLRRLVREEGVDLLYSNNQLNRNLFMVYLARDTGLPLVCHWRSMSSDGFHPRKRAMINAGMAMGIAISTVVRDHWIGQGVDPHHLELIHNGLPPMGTVAPLDLKAEFGVPEGRQTVVLVGRVEWEKNHPLMFQGFKLLLDRLPETTLLVVGDGTKLEEMRALARDMGLADKVVFTGYEARAQAIIAGADLLAQPSLTDPFSRTVLEAMALGVPVVATDVGGVREAVEHEVNGLLTPVGDAPALAEAMARLLGDPGLRTRLADNARRTIAERFDQSVQTRRIEAVLDRVLNSAPRHEPGKRA